LQKKSFLEQKNQLQQIGINCVKAGGLNWSDIYQTIKISNDQSMEAFSLDTKIGISDE
jgi:hypothetical protein